MRVGNNGEKAWVGLMTGRIWVEIFCVIGSNTFHDNFHDKLSVGIDIIWRHWMLQLILAF